MQNENRFANETESDSGKIYERPENGTFEVYYGNGQLRYQWDYKDGQRADGESKGWWPDGSWKQIKTFKNGKLNGKVKITILILLFSFLVIKMTLLVIPACLYMSIKNL